MNHITKNEGNPAGPYLEETEAVTEGGYPLLRDKLEEKGRQRPRDEFLGRRSTRARAFHADDPTRYVADSGQPRELIETLWLRKKVNQKGIQVNAAAKNRGLKNQCCHAHVK
jgi:hypothetical protein